MKIERLQPAHASAYLSLRHTFSAAEQFLVEFHDQRAGITTQAYAALPVLVDGARFASSYAWLAHTVPTGPTPVSVLDLACGDGFLLDLLSRRAQVGLELTGVDMSSGELAAARSRLGTKARLHHARAQDLPLADGATDVVLCHMALMLMDGLDQVLGEIRRVLKADGLFAFVVGARPAPTPAFERYLARLLQAREAHPSVALSFGDGRPRNPDGIRNALSAHFTQVRIQDIALPRRYTPDQLWHWFEGMYDLHVLPALQRQRFRDDYLADVATLCDADGQLAHTIMLRLVTARAAPHPGTAP